MEVHEKPATIQSSIVDLIEKKTDIIFYYLLFHQFLLLAKTNTHAKYASPFMIFAHAWDNLVHNLNKNIRALIVGVLSDISLEKERHNLSVRHIGYISGPEQLARAAQPASLHSVCLRIRTLQ